MTMCLAIQGLKVAKNAEICEPYLFELLLLLLYVIVFVSCHRPSLPGTSREPAVIPTAQASSFGLQYFPYYV